MISIGVVVVAYRSAHTISSCIESVLSQDRVSSVVVVDNSPDNDVYDVVIGYSQVDERLSYVHRPDNPGFGRACNIGATMVGQRSHICFLNPDVTLTGQIAELAELEVGHEYAILAGGLSAAEGGPFTNGRLSGRLDREMRKAVLGSRAYAIEARPPGTLSAVGQLDGALMLMSTVTFTRIGTFDERFELYYEDVDLCRSAAETGGCALLSRQFGLHIGGASSEQVSGASYAASRISRIRYFRKWARFRRFTDFALAVIALVELICRTLARTSEGRLRVDAFRAQVSELRHEGTVTCLPRRP